MTDDRETESRIHYVVNVEAAIYRDGEVLLARRSAEEGHAAGEWALVGGKVEDVATADAVLEATVAREIREEVGVEVAETEYVHSAAFVGDEGHHVINVVFLCSHGSGEPTPRDPEELAAVQWHPPSAVADRGDVPPYTREYVRAAERKRRELDW